MKKMLFLILALVMLLSVASMAMAEGETITLLYRGEPRTLAKGAAQHEAL